MNLKNENKIKYRYKIPEEKKIRVIVDTDTACEADDPFAIVHAILSPKMKVRGIVAEHFAEKDSMEKSYQAIVKIIETMEIKTQVLHGEEYPITGGKISEGVKFIIDEARKEDTKPLFLLTLGAMSNVARAIEEAPDIVKRFTVISIGGHLRKTEGEMFREFNYGNDIEAVNRVITSGIEFWQIPAETYRKVRIGLAELEYQVCDYGKIGNYLFEQLVNYSCSKEGAWAPGESWILGDSPAVAVALDPECGQFHYENTRKINEDTSWARDEQKGKIRVYTNIDTRYVIGDFLSKLHLFEKEN